MTSPFLRRGLAAIAIPVVAAVALSACASPEQEGSAPASSADVGFDAELYAAAVAAATEIAGSDALGGSLEYVGGNTGAEGAILEALYGAFSEGTGTTVTYTGTGSGSATNTAVQTRVQGGNAPDVADLSIGVAQGYAEAGELLDLSEVIGADTLAESFSPALLDAVTADDAIFGVYQGFSTFPLWYNPQQFTGPVDASSWQDIVDWTDEQAAAGTPVWCLGLEAGAGTGFPAAQLIEVLFAKKYGPELERQWGSGELSWTSPEVKDAWEMFGQIATDATVYGGVAGALSQSVTDGPLGLVSEPANCQVDIWGSWVPGVIGEAAVPTENIDFIPVPGSTPEYADTEIFQSTVSVAFVDSEQTRAFMTWLASPAAQALLASADQWTVASTAVPSSTYGSPLLQKAAEHYFSDDATLAVGPNSLATAEIGDAFNKGVVAYLQDPSSLDEVLAGIQAVNTGA